MTLCVYALARSSPGRLRSRGLQGELLRAIDVGAVAAIVGRAGRRAAPSHENLTKYHGVEEELAAAMTILPARFGTIVSSLEELTTILRQRQTSIRRALARVRGRAQMTVRIVDAGGASVTGIRPGRPGGPGQVRPTGTEYLQGLATQSRDVPGLAPVRAAVGRWIRDERVERRDRVVTIYHLVPRGAADAYARTLRAAADRAGLRVVVTGPWAPYAFSEA